MEFLWRAHCYYLKREDLEHATTINYGLYVKSPRPLRHHLRLIPPRSPPPPMFWVLGTVITRDCLDAIRGER